MSSTGPVSPSLQARIGRYYRDKFRKFGATARGVDWTCAATQEIRFYQFLSLFSCRPSFSIIDIGCGYGALVDFLDKSLSERAFHYTGMDLCGAMLRRARARYRA